MRPVKRSESLAPCKTPYIIHTDSMIISALSFSYLCCVLWFQFLIQTIQIMKGGLCYGSHTNNERAWVERDS